MTPLLLAATGLILAYGIYIASVFARNNAGASDFLDGGFAVPGWVAMFVLPGLVFSALESEHFFALVSTYGLQASHIAVGLVSVSIAALLIWNRIWFASRVAGVSTPAEALGTYYDSIALRVILLGLAVLFALPYAANTLSHIASVVEQVTQDSIPRIAGVWMLAIALGFASIIGGWRATLATLMMSSILLLLAFPTVTFFAEITSDIKGFPAAPIPVAEGIMWDRLPGVIQGVAGIGKEVPIAGIFTSVGVASSVLTLVGIVISPAALYLGQTMGEGQTLGVSTVWLTASLTAGLLLLGSPLLATRMMDGPVDLANVIYALDPLVGVLLLLMLIGAGLFMVNFLVTAGALLITRDVIIQYLLPHLTAKGQRLSGRIALGFTFFFMAFMASFMPTISAICASVASPLSVQLLPALLGLAFFRWISPGAVLAGLTLGALVVVFTEPLGIILFETLFVDLPWGRWPLTIHSAAWGLMVNLVIVGFSASVTMYADGRYRRDRLHDAVSTASQANFRHIAALGGMFLIWSFLAIGPGAVLGNTFFSNPIFTELTAELGIPSLWVWQILFWLLGVLLVWLLAYHVGFSCLTGSAIKPISLDEKPAQRRTPDWMASSLSRIK